MEENSPPSLPPTPPPSTPPPFEGTLGSPAAPPVITPPPAARSRRGGRGWMVAALILLILLAGSLLLNLGTMAGGLFGTRAVSPSYMAREYGPKLEEVLLENHHAGNKVAVVEVDGVITSQVIDQGGFSMVEVLKAELRHAEEDPRVKAVILKVDSPGGEVLASDEIARAIDRFQDDTGKPVIASMGNLAASGGYYVSVPCRWIVANELTLTGSIGVIMSSWNYRGLMNKVGVKPFVYKSGKFKDMMSGSREPDDITQQERDMLQALINETYDRFKTVVANGREQAQTLNKDQGRSLRQDWAEYADGRVVSGAEAYRVGFVDQLGNFEDAFARALKLAGITRANLVQYRLRYDLGDFFRLFGKANTERKIKIDLGMELPQLRAGQLYFLSPSFLQ